MSEEHLSDLIYVSTGRPGLGDDDLRAILAVADKRNRDIAVTGLLVYNSVNFIQVIEGGERTVRTLFARIADDPRHNGVTMLRTRRIPQRRFAGWAMGWAGVPADHEALGTHVFELDRESLTRRTAEAGELAPLFDNLYALGERAS